jgi:hypothetical protein
VLAAIEPLVPDQPEVCLVNQGRGLEGVVGGLARHPNGCQFPQFVVNERKELGGRVPVAGRGGVEEPGDVVHPVRITRRYPRRTDNPCEGRIARTLGPLAFQRASSRIGSVRGHPRE